MNLINKGDITDIFYKLKTRGLNFIVSKTNFIAKKRVKSAFNRLEINSVNYWDIPKINKHWNQLISGDPECYYEKFVCDNFLLGKPNLKMLSIGCGGGHHELRFAQNADFQSILGIDIAPKLIEKANNNAKKEGYEYLRYEVQDFYQMPLENNTFDSIHFYGSLHHFKPINLVLEKVKKALKKDGYLIIHEYVGPNRFQFEKVQIRLINKLLQTIPKQLRTKYITNRVKQKIYAPGLVRMILADPSEAADSASIRPTLNDLFISVKEVELGGNILQLLFKDIAHHFSEATDMKMDILNAVFEAENEYINNGKSDFIFGIYRPREIK